MSLLKELKSKRLRKLRIAFAYAKLFVMGTPGQIEKMKVLMKTGKV